MTFSIPLSAEKIKEARLYQEGREKGHCEGYAEGYLAGIEAAAKIADDVRNQFQPLSDWSTGCYSAAKEIGERARALAEKTEKV